MIHFCPRDADSRISETRVRRELPGSANRRTADWHVGARYALACELGGAAVKSCRLLCFLVPLFSLSARADIMTVTIAPATFLQTCQNLPAPVSATREGIGTVSLSLECWDLLHEPPIPVPVSASASFDGIRANTSVDVGKSNVGTHSVSADASLDAYFSIPVPDWAVMARTIVSWTASGFGPMARETGVVLAVDGSGIFNMVFGLPGVGEGSQTSVWAAITGPDIGRQITMRSYTVYAGYMDSAYAHLDITFNAEFATPEPTGIILLATGIVLLAVWNQRKRHRFPRLER